MVNLIQPTSLEKIAGNTLTETALTVVAALVGGPVAPLLPVLASSLASQRQKNRVETCLREITEILQEQGEAIKNISDSQYKLINETVLTALHTTSGQKLKYLRQVVRNSLVIKELDDEDAVILSRIIRDISADEATFLLSHFHHKRIQLGVLSENTPRSLVVKSNGRDELTLAGLISLGLVIPAGPTIDDSGLLRFSSIVGKVITLLSANPS